MVIRGKPYFMLFGMPIIQNMIFRILSNYLWFRWSVRGRLSRSSTWLDNATFFQIIGCNACCYSCRNPKWCSIYTWCKSGVAHYQPDWMDQSAGSLTWHESHTSIANRGILSEGSYSCSICEQWDLTSHLSRYKLRQLFLPKRECNHGGSGTWL